MRVIAGKVKGHRLKFPRGAPTRPATDLVRGAIFDILTTDPDQDWERVLDLYSGSGAMGIEALSRGAGSVDFIDRDPRCCAIIKENLAHTGLTAQARVHCTEVNRALSQMETDYDLVLIDPPYADRSIGQVLSDLAASPALNPKTTVVVTHSSRFDLAPDYAELKQYREKRHGDSVIAFYRKEA